MKDKNIKYKPRRDTEEQKSVKDFLKHLNDEDTKELEEEVEEIIRLGPHDKG